MDAAALWSVHVIGAPGFGKSTFQGNFAEQCIAAGEGVILFDVKGDLARNVVMRTQYFDRLIYIAPHEAAAAGHYWSLNPLEFDRTQRHEFSSHATAMTEILEHIGQYDPKQMRDIHKFVSESVALALSDRDATFCVR